MQKLNVSLILAVAFVVALPNPAALAKGKDNNALAKSNNITGIKSAAKQRSSCSRVSGSGTCLPSPPPGGPVPLPYPTTGVRQ